MRRAAEHGVVKVARILAVNRHQRHVAQVHALRRICRRHLIGQGGGLRQRLFGKFVRHAVFAHRNLQLHARVVNLPQHLLHAPHRLAVERGRLGQQHAHHLSRLGAAQRISRGDEHIASVAFVLRRHQPHAVFAQQAPDDGRLQRALQNLRHAPLRTPAPVAAHHAHRHAVTVQHRAHLGGGKVDVWLPIAHDDEAVPITMPLHRANNFPGSSRGGGRFPIQLRFS